MLHVFFGAVPNSQWSQKNIFLDYILFIFIELSVLKMKNESILKIGALQKPLILLKELYFSDFFIRIRNLNTLLMLQIKKISKSNNLEDWSWSYMIFKIVVFRDFFFICNLSM